MGMVLRSFYIHETVNKTRVAPWQLIMYVYILRVNNSGIQRLLLLIIFSFILPNFDGGELPEKEK